MVQIRKLFLEPRQCAFEILWDDHWLFSRPELLDDLSVRDGQQTLACQGIARVYFWDEMTLEKVVRQSFAVAEALQRAVHVTRIGEILETY